MIKLRQKLFGWTSAVNLRRDLIIRSSATLAVIAVFVFLFLRYFDSAKVWEILGGVHYGIFALALVIYYASFFTKTIKWEILLKSIGIKEKFSHVFYALFSCFFLNCLFPLRLGDLYRVYLLKKKRSHPISKTGATLFIEKIVDVFLLVVMLVISGWILFSGQLPSTVLQIFKGSIILVVVFMIIMVGTLLFGDKKVPFVPERFQHVMVNFKQAVKLCLTPLRLFYVMFWSFLDWCFFFVFFYLVGLSLEVQMGLALVVFIVVAENLLGAIPLTPAGLGFVEFGIAALLILVGFDKNLSISIALLARLGTYWSQMVFGLIVYLAVDQKKIFA